MRDLLRGKMIKLQGFALILLALLLPAVTSGQQHKLVFAPQWLPQAQFAGYYAALDQNFYRDAGLDVEIVHPSAAVQNTAMLTSGKADIISLFLITGLTFREKGMDMVNIGQLSNHSALLFVTKKTSGINSLDQLNGKKIAVWKSGFDEVPKALIAERKLSVDWVPILFSINLFMLDAVDAMTVMVYNEYDQIVNCGLNEDELNVFRISDYGFDIPEDGLYCLSQTRETRGEELRLFVEATYKGWEYAAAHREYAIDLVIAMMEKEHVAANRAHQGWMFDHVLEMMRLPAGGEKRGVLPEYAFLKASEIVERYTGRKVRSSYSVFIRPVINESKR